MNFEQKKVTRAHITAPRTRFAAVRLPEKIIHNSSRTTNISVVPPSFFSFRYIWNERGRDSSSAEICLGRLSEARIKSGTQDHSRSVPLSHHYYYIYFIFLSVFMITQAYTDDNSVLSKQLFFSVCCLFCLYASVQTSGHFMPVLLLGNTSCAGTAIMIE